MTATIAQHIQEVRQRMENAARRSGRDVSDITLMAVTKMVEPEVARNCFNCGVENLGENRVQELRRKLPYIPQARWHLIGRLQTNKVKDIVGKVCLIHSLDRWELAEAINKRYVMQDLKAPVLLQVNISGEQQKAGVAPDEVEPFLNSIGQLDAIEVKGLMTIAPAVDNPEETRPVFKELYHLKTMLDRHSFKNVELQYLSMGMSHDFEVAIEEGANIIRVGSAIFHDEYDDKKEEDEK